MNIIIQDKIVNLWTAVFFYSKLCLIIHGQSQHEHFIDIPLEIAESH
jgi:hypothetical protein